MKFYDEPYPSRQSPAAAGLTRKGGAAERATPDVYAGWSDTQLVTTCWLCGKNGCGDPLDKHHIFGNAYRKKSEKYGLVVPLCHKECHQFGKYAVHQNAETMRRLHEYGQRKAMEEQGWTVRQFAVEFGRNYLDVGPDDWDLTLEEIDGQTGDGIPRSAKPTAPFDKGAMRGRKAAPRKMAIAWDAPLPF